MSQDYRPGALAAAIMGDAYPDLYAAIGVHSGLACGAARDMPSALTAMQRGAAENVRPARQTCRASHRVPRRTAMRRCTPRNGDAVVAQSVQNAPLRTRVETGRVPGGHAYTKTLHMKPDGTVTVEKWLVHGAGHAWFGGSPAGSYTDPRGPDASGEMMRFFLARTLA